tara:strand:+ start:4606 stop:5739 length:1134 start_codon:yes stop_codon:yes gene_type:complete
MAESMPITPAVVTWARERAGFSVDAAVSDFRKIVEWEAGEAFPSYSQLERMADKFKVPVAVFFFPAPPDLPPIEETFRTLGPDQIAEIPPRIRLLLRKARTFQMGVEELNGGRNSAERLITRDLAFRPTDRIEEIAAQVRAYLGVTIEQQFAWGNAETALEEWRKVLLGVGIYVFKDSFREPDYSGFCLYDDEFPIIYVNNTTAKTRQIFTLFHELAHLLFHTSGVDRTGDGFVDELVGDNRRIEVICNRMAACLLVPEDAFDAAFGGQAPTEATAAELAQLFSVSREFIFRKFLDRDLITPGEYDLAARRWAEQGQRGTGGDHYNTKIAYLGTEYINLAFQRFYQNQIDYNQLADILDTKPKNLTRLEEYASRRTP